MLVRGSARASPHLPSTPFVVAELMTNPAKHVSRVRGAMPSLDHGRRLAFAAACAERLLPLYNRFSQQANWGDAAALRRAVSQVWHAADGGAVDSDAIADLMRQCEAAAPETEDFRQPLTSAALSAATAADLDVGTPPWCGD